MSYAASATAKRTNMAIIDFYALVSSGIQQSFEILPG
jgi:hypothetical protein